MAWYPANPYENYDSERFLNDLIGWSERIRHRLEHAPISVSLEDLPAIIPLLDAHHRYAAAGERVQKKEKPTVELFFEELGDNFSDWMQEALTIAICHAPPRGLSWRRLASLTSCTCWSFWMNPIASWTIHSSGGEPRR